VVAQRRGERGEVAACQLRAHHARPCGRTPGTGLAAVSVTPGFARHFHGIAVDAVDAEFEVQVRAGGPAGGADGADGLALADLLALAHVDAAQVGIDRDVGARCGA
jgi:hypothetical protein